MKAFRTPKRVKDLQWFVAQGRKQGIYISGGVNGGGWVMTALSCGCSNAIDRASARKALVTRFGEPPLPARQSRGKSNLTPVASSEYDRVAQQMRARAQANKVQQVLVRGIDVVSDAFLSTYEWRRVRMIALKKYGAQCQCCGATPAHGAVMNVDHIKPRRVFPQLALDVDNLQVLCHECNHGKGSWDMTDWRDVHQPDDGLDEDQRNHLRDIMRG